MPETSMTHITEQDFVLHFYGELDARTAAHTDAHLAECAECRRSYARLQRVMAAVDTMPDPVLPEGFERTTWARLQPSLELRSGWQRWLLFSSPRVAFAAAVVILVAGAFYAGRMTRESTPAAVSAEQIREAVLLADLGEHLDRSQMMLVDLVSAEEGSADLSSERRLAAELVAANRLYRQTAEESGEARVTELLDELERLLVDLAASPDTMSADDMNKVRQRIDANGLLFKVRVLSTAVRERQRQQIRVRAGQSS